MELIKRIITALILFFSLMAAWSAGGLILELCLILAALLGSYEFYSMFLDKSKKDEMKVLIFACFLPILSLLIAFYTPAGGALSFALMFIIVAIFTLFRWTSNEDKALKEGAVLLAGLFYLPVIILLVSYLSPYEILYVFFLPAVNDTFAYITGLTCGKHKVWVAVSPKKSIEGCIGGLVAAVVFSVFFCTHYGTGPWWAYLFLGIILSIIAQLGDFFESALKRATGVKDSSNILPGHGGILDRLDSILFVVPLFLFAMTLFPSLRF